MCSSQKRTYFITYAIMTFATIMYKYPSPVLEGPVLFNLQATASSGKHTGVSGRQLTEEGDPSGLMKGGEGTHLKGSDSHWREEDSWGKEKPSKAES